MRVKSDQLQFKDDLEKQQRSEAGSWFRPGSEILGIKCTLFSRPVSLSNVSYTCLQSKFAWKRRIYACDAETLVSWSFIPFENFDMQLSPRDLTLPRWPHFASTRVMFWLFRRYRALPYTTAGEWVRACVRRLNQLRKIIALILNSRTSQFTLLTLFQANS